LADLLGRAARCLAGCGDPRLACILGCGDDPSRLLLRRRDDRMRFTSGLLEGALGIAHSSRLAQVMLLLARTSGGGAPRVA